MSPQTITLDRHWRRYRVSLAKRERGKAMELTPWIEKTVSFRTRRWVEAGEGAQILRFQKEDRIEDDTSILWDFSLDTEDARLLKLEKTYFDEDGEEFAHTRYDYEASPWRLPPFLAHIFSLSAVLENAALGRDFRLGLHVMVTEDAVPFGIGLVDKKGERVRTPAGSFECRRVAIEPDYHDILGRWAWAKTIINPFVPEFQFWLTEERPHRLIRFKGRLGPVGAASLQTFEFEGMDEPDADEGGENG